MTKPPLDPSPTATPSPPPTPAAPAQDTSRYLAWMNAQGKPVTDTATEVVALRLGGWGFFAHGGGPGQSLDRTGLDDANHAIQAGDRAGAWHAFLVTPGLDADGAAQRVAWLYSAIPIDPGPRYPQVKAPSVVIERDKVTLTSYVAFPPETGRVMRMTIVADHHGAKISTEPTAK